MVNIPFVISGNGEGRGQYDIFSLLLKNRIVFINGPIEDNMAASVIAQLLYLDAQDAQKEIFVYINSPGGSVTAGMTIYDTVRHIQAPVHTIGMGLVASMGSVLLASGDRRSVLPHVKVMIHQPSIQGGLGGRETDISILARDLADTRKMIAKVLSQRCGKPADDVEKDIENDFYLSAEQALSYGLVDDIIELN